MSELEDGLFPQKRRDEDADPEEERRLFYVALTPARKKVGFKEIEMKILTILAILAGLAVGACTASGEDYVSQPFDPSEEAGWGLFIEQTCPAADGAEFLVKFHVLPDPTGRYAATGTVLSFTFVRRENSHTVGTILASAFADKTSDKMSLFAYVPQKNMWRAVEVELQDKEAVKEGEVVWLTQLGKTADHFGVKDPFVACYNETMLNMQNSGF